MENKIIKKDFAFKIKIEDSLEKQIRFLCSKFPKNEYSGTLFYTIEGSFENKDLVIIAKDFYLQDIGSAAFTKFKMDNSVSTYMVENELFDCYQGLMH